MRSIWRIASVALLIAACTEHTTSESPAPDHVAATAPTRSTTRAERSGSSLAERRALSGRTGELVNPDDATIVLLYYDVAGIEPPIDQWVANDHRIALAPGAQKAELRKTIRAELESAARAVRGIGLLRLTMNAKLSEYDPTYGEFSVRALAPSSVIEFRAMNQKVSLKFSNGQTAQIWRVPPADAQIIKDKIGPYRSDISLDASLVITGVNPSPGGGTITVDVIEYEMRGGRDGMLIGRVQVAQQ